MRFFDDQLESMRVVQEVAEDLRSTARRSIEQSRELRAATAKFIASRRRATIGHAEPLKQAQEAP